jgi:hypothetical protein
MDIKMTASGWTVRQIDVVLPEGIGVTKIFTVGKMNRTLL